ncbi:ABC transporter substrate-binding protein [Paraburkholderia fungorum]|uniref:ABC transporter substrate-binding protein n=1 Tax=Paraburkholderia fungorum TaxID=134537 RepID=UPI0038779418
MKRSFALSPLLRPALRRALRRAFVAWSMTLPLTAAALLGPCLARAEDAPKVVRIAVVAYSSGGKTQYAGASALIDADKSLEKALAARHIQLQWVPVSTAAVGTLVNEAFTNHSIDFAGYGDLPSVVVNASGTHTKLIVPGGVGSNTYLVVPANSTAKSIVDLKGKRIALNRGRPWEVTFGKLLAANGLKLSDFKIYNLDPQAGAAAVSAGRVDGFFTLSDAYPLVDKQVGKIIWSTKEAPDAWKMRAELWASDDFVRQYPDVTQLVATAYVRAAYWISQAQNRDAFIKILSASGQPENVVRREYDDEKQPWKEQWAPLFTPSLSAHYRDVSAYSQQARLTSGGVDVNSLLAPQFVNNALKELKLEHYWDASATTNVANR